MGSTHLPGKVGRTLCGSVTNRIVAKNTTCIACQNGGKSPGSQRKTFDQDWSRKCIVCESSPVVPETGMCGPCTTGESETIGGNW